MRLHATFSETGDKVFSVRFGHDKKAFDTSFGQIQHLTKYVGGDPYDGEYAITPKVEAQTMPTKQKVMLDDVTVLAIPYAEVTNNANGQTATIG